MRQSFFFHQRQVGLSSQKITLTKTLEPKQLSHLLGCLGCLSVVEIVVCFLSSRPSFVEQRWEKKEKEKKHNMHRDCFHSTLAQWKNQGNLPQTQNTSPCNGTEPFEEDMSISSFLSPVCLFEYNQGLVLKGLKVLLLSHLDDKQFWEEQKSLLKVRYGQN